ncbi:hypothetical protein M413DRAFT_444245 [Hebeloma cylindrosporum]|uniref:BCAS3 WD40 domain-containing protein n=1 Tax=Hebeloma cylindrosporum TaxID=76867 RepID=A0A0C2YNA5_HEBCY|nr:hypothetical protein M413DRAFT_444245 [Hebeloma cylindrosporum h7]
MPQRPSRDNNARNNKPRARQSDQHRHRVSPSLSPPAQLPTPLPDEQIPHFHSTMDSVGQPQSLGSPFGHEALAETSTSRLIDFDTPPFQIASLPAEQVNLDDQEKDDSGGTLASTYRSAPFREAPLPNQVGSPPPLPIPPRIPYPQDYFEDVGPGDAVDVGFGGRIRSPTFSRSRPLSPHRHSDSPSSSTLENLSRTIRDYVPSSIHIPIPTAGPSPPLVSRPIVSYAQFSGSPTTSTHQRSPSTPQLTHKRTTSQEQEFEREYEREGEFGYGYGYGHDYAQPQPQRAAMLVQTSTRAQHTPPPSGFPGSGLAQAMRRGAAGMTGSFIGRGVGRGVGSTSVPAPASKRALVNEKGIVDAISWARWDILNARHVLILAYPAGLQMWDCADLASISEVFNLNFDLPEWELVVGRRGARGDGSDAAAQQVRVVHAAVLPPPSHRAMIPHGGKDPFAESRPLLGILLEDADEDEREELARSTFVLYSLRTHQVMKMLSMPGLSSTFVPNELFIVISTTTPPTLHVLSSTTFDTLHTVNENLLEAYRPPSQHSTLSHHPGSSYSSSAISITNAISSTAQSAFNNSSTNKGVFLPGLSIDGKTSNNNNNDNNYDGGSAHGGTSPESTRPIKVHPHPVFALSHRLLAYASPCPASSSSPSLLGVGASTNVSSKANRRLSSSSAGSTSQHSGGTPSSLSSSPFGLGGGITKMTGMTQADVGQAALKVGESVFSGMKFLGGMALDAAKSRVTGKGAVGAGGTPEGRVGGYGHARSASRTGEVRMRSGSPGGRFVSRSAPDNPGSMPGQDPRVVMTEDRERRNSNVSSASSSVPPSPQVHLATVMPHTRGVAENGHFVTVVDLSPLLPTSSKSSKANEGDSGRPKSTSQTRGPTPIKVDEFNASRSQTLAGLQFSPDGTSLAVITRDGHSVKIFKLHPTPSVLLSARSAALEEAGLASGSGSSGLSELDRKSATQVYELHRGHTTAVVEGFDWARDGLWTALGTRNRTVHVFAVNPYGGPPDLQSHLEARVRNVELVESRLTSLKPLARIRSPKVSSAPGQPKAPLAFTFIAPSDITFSPDLLPPYAPQLVSNSPTFSPSKPKRIVNYQDLLLFDPVDGVLSLRRLIIDKHPVKESIGSGVAASVQAFGVTSISFPGMGGGDRISLSPSTSGASRGGSRTSHSPQVGGDPQMELFAKEGMVATWDLRRKRDWAEFKRPVTPNLVVTGGGGLGGRGKGGMLGRDWLAEGELSTCSNSPRVLPRSLYLSHQFSFHTLGEDYHALLRRYQLDITGTKIEVRRTIEISPYTSGGDNAAFVEGFSSPRDARRLSSSFDEPIASAISGSLDSSNLPIILPMYPNGIPGSNPRSFRSSIPIRTMAGIGDGVSEGLGRLRRDFHKARSPQLVARSDSSLSGPVPLEFDEEDEDFLKREDDPALDIPSSHAGGGGPTSREPSREASAADSASIVTPASSSTHQLLDADVVGTVDEEIWQGWDQEDKLAVEEAEQFDDIAVVGYQVEAQEQRQYVQKNSAAATAETGVLSAESKRKGRSKRRG